MQREELRQRIQYLVEHGGAYPDAPPDRTSKVMLWLLVLIAVAEVIEVFHLLH